MKSISLNCVIGVVATLSAVLASPVSIPKFTTTIDSISKRDLTFKHPCPPICNSRGECGCAAEPPIEKRSLTLTLAKPTTQDRSPVQKPEVDNTCLCFGVSCPCPTSTRPIDYSHPCQPICNDHTCVCNAAPVSNEKDSTKAEVAYTPIETCNDDNECSCNPFPPKEKRGEKFVHPCPLICDQNGCVCDPLPPKDKNKRDVRLEDSVKMCPGLLVCDDEYCACGDKVA